MPIFIPVPTIKKALEDAVDALMELGETVTYKFADGASSVTIRAVRQKLREDELVGEYMQGDCRFTINFKDLPQAPAKYDQIVAADGITYSIFEYLAVDRGIDNQILVYRPVGRG